MKLTVINGCGLESAGLSQWLDSAGVSPQNPDAAWEIIDLSRYHLKGCAGCDACQSIMPGACAFTDGINDILRRYLESDKVIIITSIRFGSFNALTKNFIDRTEPLFLPYQVRKNGKTQMKSRYDRYPNLLIAGIAEDGDAQAAEAFRFIAANTSLAAVSGKAEVIVTDGGGKAGAFTQPRKRKEPV